MGSSWWLSTRVQRQCQSQRNLRWMLWTTSSCSVSAVCLWIAGVRHGCGCLQVRHYRWNCLLHFNIFLLYWPTTHTRCLLGLAGCAASSRGVPGPLQAHPHPEELGHSVSVRYLVVRYNTIPTESCYDSTWFLFSLQEAGSLRYTRRFARKARLIDELLHFKNQP